MEILKRLGTSRESVSRLSRKAAEAEARLGIYGVSVTAGPPRGPVSTVPREIVEQHFRVHDTKSDADPLHRTVELPKPISQQTADPFNQLFGRS